MESRGSARKLEDPLMSDGDAPADGGGGGGGSGGVPRREQLLHVSWMFLFASLTLLAEFMMFYTNYPSAGGGMLCFGIGLVSSVEWLHGFIILLHWTWMLPGKKNAASLVACSLKLLASVFFCVFPYTGLLGTPCMWSNFVGILLFHSGNMIDTFFMTRNSCDMRRCCSPANYPTITMWTLLLATTFLVTGNSVAYVQGNGGLANVSATTLTLVEATGQITGSSLLTIGSVMSIYNSRKISSRASDGE